MRFDVENRLKLYMPSLFELIGDNTFDWRKIERAFEKKFIELEEKYNNIGRPFKTKASLFGIITAVLNNEEGAIYLFEYIDKLFKELTLSLSSDEKKLIIKNVFDVLVNMDEKYLNFIGELSLLNQFLKSGNFKLLEVEAPLDEGIVSTSHIDFTLFDKNNESELLLEVVNVHLKDENTSDDYKIERLIDQKIQEKYRVTSGNSDKKFILAPILWGSHKWIKRILNYYLKLDVKLDNILMPSCFVPFIDQDGNRVYKFGVMNAIFEQERNKGF